MYRVHGRWACLSSTDLDPEGEELEDALDGEEDGEDGVEPAQRVRVVRRLVVELQAQQHKQPLTHTKQLHMCTQQHAVAANQSVTYLHQEYDGVERDELLTFIMRMMVLSAMSVMMKYSNGLETTMRQMRYFIDSLSSGM